MISVIVPVYNVSKYLPKCLNSILNQSYTNLEVIVINDGSTDDSGAICEEFQGKDSRIKVIHKKNGGLSSARNAGLEVASGEFVGFIDSDDWIERDFFALLHEGITKNNSDIAVVQFLKIRNFEKIEVQTSSFNEWTVFSRESAMKAMFDKSIGYSAVNKLYRKHLFDGIRYPEGFLMEDKGTTYKLIHRSDKVAVNMSTKYHYYLRDNSIMRSQFSERSFDSFLFHEEMIAFIDMKYPELSTLVREKYGHTAIKSLLNVIASRCTQQEHIDRCLTVLNENRKYILSGNASSNNIKLFSLVIGIPGLAYMATRSKLCSSFVQKVGY